MPISSRKNKLAFAGLLALALSGCGDGSTTTGTAATSPDTPAPSVTPSPSPTPTPTPNTAGTTEIVISGVVAMGAPCADAPVAFPDSATTSSPVRTANDGSYKATLTVAIKDVTKPLVVMAECPNTTGGTDTLVSISATRASGTVNVNPLTNLIGALLAKAGDPRKLGIELENGTVTIDNAAIRDKVDLSREILLPMLNALTLASTFDPIKGSASADGSGFDRLLDMLDIEITPEADNASSIAVRMKIRSANDADSQPVIRFTNVTPLDVIKLNNKIDAFSVQQVQFVAALMIPSGTAELIADLIGRINGCYALPVLYRVNQGEVLAKCSAMYVDANINNFLEDGLRGMDAVYVQITSLSPSDSVGSRLLTEGDGVRYSLGAYQYLRPDGVLGFTALKKSTGNPDETVAVEAQVGVDGKLGISGNHYQFQAKLVASAERRTFLNQNTNFVPANYLSTGVRIVVPLQNKEGTAVTKVIVTPPANRLPGNRASFTMLPGADGMAFPSQDAALNDMPVPSAGGFLRLRTEYTDATPGVNRQHPSRRDIGQYFANDITESALQQFSPGDVWTIAFYFGNETTPAASQYYRLPARPLTIGELRPLAVPDLTTSTKTFLSSLLTGDGGNIPGFSPLTGLPPLTLPTVANPVPAELRVFGYTAPINADANIFFMDSRYLLYIDFQNRTVLCSNGAIGDLHCAANGNYVSDAILEGVEVVSRFPDKREVANHFSVRQLEP